jgi:hypothetical protein
MPKALILAPGTLAVVRDILQLSNLLNLFKSIRMLLNSRK